MNVIPIHIPPLRERREDIPVLVEHFIAKHAQRAGKRIEAVAPGVMQGLHATDWPGNVRELENTIERAVVLSLTPTIGAEVVRVLDTGSSPPPGLPSLNLRQNRTGPSAKPYAARWRAPEGSRKRRPKRWGSASAR
jgi:DNA-binding NtrC family response regulator